MRHNLLTLVFSLLFIESVSFRIRTRVTNRRFWAASSNIEPSVLTKQIFEKMQAEVQAGGAGGSSSLDGLIGLERSWQHLKNGGWKTNPATIVYEHQTQCPNNKASDFDVVICGGTLGIFFAAALQKMGIKTCVVERGKVVGRPQEWNISRFFTQTHYSLVSS